MKKDEEEKVGNLELKYEEELENMRNDYDAEIEQLASTISKLQEIAPKAETSVEVTSLKQEIS